MRAVVLAAGKGTRLGERTQQVPKPMISVRGAPVLEHNIRWLAGHGVRELYLNLHHLPEVVRGHFGDGSAFGVSIRYSEEERLLGTAGAVRRIADRFWTEEPRPFWVIYGDNLLTYDLGQVRAFHAQRGGVGTIVVYEKADVSQSGIVDIEADGRIRRFIEKPRPEEVVSHLVNTGIYRLEPEVLSSIPEGASDFGHDIFPRLLAEERALYAVVVPGELTAIDTPALLREAEAEEP